MQSLDKWMCDRFREWEVNNLIFQKAGVEQMLFFKNIISGMFYPDGLRYKEGEINLSKYNDRIDFCKIGGFHTSKSVTLPVYYITSCIGGNHIEIYARNNFYNWNVSIDCSKRLDIPEYFKIDNGKDHLFLEGMENLNFGPYCENNNKFSFAVYSGYSLYAILWNIRSQLE